MKKLITSILLLIASASAFADGTASCWQVIQRNEADNGAYIRYACPPATGDGILLHDSTINQPAQLKLGSGLLRSGDTLTAPGPDLSSFASTASVTAGLATKYNTPGGTVLQYVRGDGSLATLPSSASFNFGAPAAKTVAVSTAYQAADPSKAAIVTLSPACTNTTTLLAASACTMQIRQGGSGLTCSTGTVVSTWSSTIALGLVITQGNSFPVEVKLPSGGYFIVCPSAGTFTISAVEQVAG